jgi:hypothetical protein
MYAFSALLRNTGLTLGRTGIGFKRKDEENGFK